MLIPVLIEALHNYIPAEGKLLWVIEEAGSIPPDFIARYAARSQVLSNRFDLHRQYQQSCASVLSDFELDEKDFSTVIFYVSKERLLSNFVIAASATWLKNGGSLILLGKKNEGIKNYFGKLKAKTALKKHGDLYIGESYQPDENIPDLNAYKQEIEFSDAENLAFVSKPGVFSWKKIDQGSAFLIRSLQEKHIQFNGKSVFDLGCGNGYLALHAARLGAEQVCASENNFTAIAICQKNFQLNNIRGEVVIDDCAASINTRFQTVLCNPPFHKGKNTESELTERFVKAASRLLNNDGEAWFVVNAFIPLEKIAASWFQEIVTLANNRQFKVLQLKKPLTKKPQTKKPRTKNPPT